MLAGTGGLADSMYWEVLGLGWQYVLGGPGARLAVCTGSWGMAGNVYLGSGRRRNRVGLFRFTFNYSTYFGGGGGGAKCIHSLIAKSILGMRNHSPHAIPLVGYSFLVNNLK